MGRGIWKPVAMTAAMLALGGVIVRPLYRDFQQTRSARRAEHSLAQTNYPAASISARQALQLNSNSVPACQVMAKLAERSNSSEAIYWRERLVQIEPGNASHHFSLIQAAMLFQRDALARKTLATVPEPARRTNALYRQLAAQLAFADHDFDGAEKHLVAATKLVSSNAAHTHNLHIVRLHSQDTNTVHDARQRLETAQFDPVYGPAILRALVGEAIGRNTLARARQLSLRLLENPSATFHDRLLHLTLLNALCSVKTQADAEERRTALKAAVATSQLPTARVPPTTGLSLGLDRSGEGNRAEFNTLLAALQTEAGGSCERSTELLNWLVDHHHAQAGLDWIERLPESLRREMPVRRAEAGCYIAGQRWGDLAALLERSQWSGDDYLRHAFLALAYRKLNDETLAQVEWKRAIRAGAPAATAILVRLAGEWHWEKEAEEVLWSAAKGGPEGSWAIVLLAQGYELAGNTRSLLRLFQSTASQNPNDLIAKNNVAAASFLLRTNLPAAHDDAREVYTAQPDNSAFACTYAYSLHLQGRTGEGVRLMAKFPEATSGNASTAAYYGLMLRAQGDAEAADRYLAFARKGALLPEERALVEQTDP